MPLILEDVNGDRTGGGGDVWVVDLGDELYFGRYEGITFWEDDVLQRRSESATRRRGMLRWPGKKEDSGTY